MMPSASGGHMSFSRLNDNRKSSSTSSSPPNSLIDKKSSGFPARLRLPVLAASRMLKKRFSSAAELLKSTEMWMHTTPSKNCDIVVTFPVNTSEYTVMWLLTRIRSRTPDLEVHLRKLNMTGVYGLYVTCSTYERILREAESLRIRKRLQVEYGGGLQEFIFERAHRFEGIVDVETFFSSQERQSIVLNMLNELSATDDEELNGVKFVEGQAIIPKCLSVGIISQVFPLHNNVSLQSLRQIWVQAFFKPQPLDNICDYFGVKIAMYFAWLGHYTTALTIPAVFGFILWILFYENQVAEDICFVLFAFFNVIWTTLYLESWKRRQAELAYRWGTLDQTSGLLQEPRPLFRGPYEKSPVTGHLESTYPNWKRNVSRYCVSLPVIIICLAFVCFTIFTIFELEMWWNHRMEIQEYPAWVFYLPKILMALVICAMDETYHWIATQLNNLENYRLEEEYENHLTIKMGVFQFVSAFVSLFYIAFYLQDMDKLRYLLATLLITRQVVGNIKESIVPFLAGRLKLLLMNLRIIETPLTSPTDATCRDKDNRINHRWSSGIVEGNHRRASKKKSKPAATPDVDRINVSQAELESNMFPYEGTFEDYLEMFIQFGYVMLFSSAFPLAAVCALLNNLIEIRSDAFKLCCSLQRPFSVRTADIGAWQTMMEVMGVIAITVNCALIGMSGQVQRIFPDLSSTGQIVLIIVLEHLMLAIKYVLSHAINGVPSWVAIEMAKVEFKRRQALRELDPFENSSLVRKTSKKQFDKIDSSNADIEIHAPASDEDSSILDDISHNSDPVFDDERADSSASEAELRVIQNSKIPTSQPTAPWVSVSGPPEVVMYPRPVEITTTPSDEYGKSEDNKVPMTNSETSSSRHRRHMDVQSSCQQTTNTVKISLPFFGHHLKIPSPLKLVRRKSAGDNSPPVEEAKELATPTTGDDVVHDGVIEEVPLLKRSDGSRRFSVFSRGKHGKLK